MRPLIGLSPGGGVLRTGPVAALAMIALAPAASSRMGANGCVGYSVILVRIPRVRT
jgi:hypothetical protein